MTDTQKQFFERIDCLNSGERASLRRSAGMALGEADGSAMAAFYKCLPVAVDVWQEEKWFAIACLRCLWEPGGDEGKPIEELISELINNGELSDSTRHRIEILLDTKWDKDGYMLSKLVRTIKLVRQKSDRSRIDFSKLLEDLLNWNHERQIVQRKWARAIFSNTKEEQ